MDTASDQKIADAIRLQADKLCTMLDQADQNDLSVSVRLTRQPKWKPEITVRRVIKL